MRFTTSTIYAILPVAYLGGGACGHALCRHYGLPLTKILATPLYITSGKPSTQS